MTDSNDPGQVRLLGATRIRQLAQELGIKPTKTLGQNFVHDGNTVRRIISQAELRPDDHVLEVGPGLGSLTLGLLDAAKAVTVVEIDERLAARLPTTVSEQAPHLSDRLRVITADAMSIRAVDLPESPTALVANLPYNVSVPVLLHLLSELPSIRRVLVMVQAEVADRLAAGPGSKTYGSPSVKASWYGVTKRAGAIGRNVFWPAPNVDSALVAFDRHEVPTAGNRAKVFSVVDAAFAQRRKTLRAALSGWAGSPAMAEAILRRAGIDPSARGETLDFRQFRAIALAADLERAAADPVDAESSDFDKAGTSSSAQSASPATRIEDQ